MYIHSTVFLVLNGAAAPNFLYFYMQLFKIYPCARNRTKMPMTFIQKRHATKISIAINTKTIRGISNQRSMIPWNFNGLTISCLVVMVIGTCKPKNYQQNYTSKYKQSQCKQTWANRRCYMSTTRQRNQTSINIKPISFCWSLDLNTI